ncbi:hypothetical protein [Salsuginibacillus kocurii]|uniref:hypothetical protein n=1 Tax=Salsuginibacillus kocurii TaxID=427078 RepID=UPI00039F7110|nr:hypothetical protein [Salsuginibacillus kocurii]
MKDWFEQQWLKFLLPDHLKPVDDQIFSDPNGLAIVKETEAALEKIIHHAISTQAKKPAQTFKKNDQSFKMRLKINQKRFKLLSYETAQSDAAIKKRIVIECLRKYEQPKSRAKRLKEASVHYMKNGKTYVRSLHKSPHFQRIFNQLDQLDDALLGQLRNVPSASQQTRDQLENSTGSKEVDQLQGALASLKRDIRRQEGKFNHVLTHRLSILIDQLEPLSSKAEQLDIEERHHIRRLITKDLPTLIEAYETLPAEKQESEMEAFYEALIKMELNIQQFQASINAEKENHWEQLLRLNNVRYDRHLKDRE